MTGSEISKVARNAAMAGQKAFLSHQNAAAGCASCARDYSESCPLGWGEEGLACIAPHSYSGFCKKTNTFLGSATEKQSIENQCSVCWPCSDNDGPTCIRNWGASCPNGYDMSLGGTCVADAFYNGPCAAELKFESLEDKQEFAAACLTSWPCERGQGASLAATPLLDLPRELIMDVNKAPFPIVNVIAEPPARPSVGRAAALNTQWLGDRATGVEHLANRSASMGAIMRKQQALLRKVSSLSKASAKLQH